MKTYIIGRKHRRHIHFYSEPESTRKIKLEIDDPAFNEYQNMFSLKIGDKFDIISINGSFGYKPTFYTFYKKCEILYFGTIEHNYKKNFVMINCERINNNITEQDANKIIRKEKLKKLKDYET